MQSPPSAFAASLGPYRITSNSKERGDTWRRLLKLRQARKDKEEAEVLDLICYAQHLLNRKKEIEMATEAIETKMARAGELAVSVVQSKDVLKVQI